MPSRLSRWLRLWFTFESGVRRREYLLSGLALAALKYAGDAFMVWNSTGRLWRPIDYLSPVSTLTQTKLAMAPAELLPVLALWSLPFLWIGISMSMRRSLDSGHSAWLGLLFFVPVVSYLFIATMCLLPSAPAKNPPMHEPRSYEHRLPSALLAIAAGMAIGLGMLALSVYGLSSYGLSLFLGTPFVIGALTAFLFNRRYPASAKETQQVVLMTLACVGGVLLVTAAEGALCLIMAAPLGIGIGAMGAALGRRIAIRDRSLANALMAVMVLPISATFDAGRPPTELREVRSASEIDAPPDVVWRNVIAFPPFPPPRELAFRAGIAYPVRAEITGEGVGAVRRCVFSTGAFVEPITRWEPGRTLSFDVDSQPRPLHEWSPYRDVAAPHLDGYFVSRRGEFRLVALPNGHTRLEGSTWYEMKLQPAAYWVLYGDVIVHRIHMQVLEHIRSTTEVEMARRAAVAAPRRL
jgi:uncharacterized membrane protein YhaH (DUF805 family)